MNISWNNLTKAEAEIVRCDVLKSGKEFTHSSGFIFYESPKLRVICVADPHKLYWWFGEVRKEDIIIVSHSFCRIDSIFTRDWLFFKAFDFPVENVYLRCDSRDVVQAAFDRGFVHAEFVNHNCFLDERLYGFQEKGFEKKYHAALIAKMAAYKRVFLAKEVKDLALIFGDIYKSDIREGSSIPSHMYKNEKMLSAKEVGEIVQQSYSGLCLSQIEGSCWASNEYLLCGVPVVSTVSRGGRNVWYNPTNSIVCQPNPRSVAESVEFFVKNPPDPLIIRGECIRQTSQFRKTFVVMLQSIFDRFDVKEDASEWFRKNFFHKMENWEEHKVLAEMIRESNKRIKEKQDVGQTAEAAVKVS